MPHSWLLKLEEFPRAATLLALGYLVSIMGFMSIFMFRLDILFIEWFGVALAGKLMFVLVIAIAFLYFCGLVISFAAMEHARVHGKYRWFFGIVYSACLMSFFYLHLVVGPDAQSMDST